MKNPITLAFESIGHAAELFATQFMLLADPACRQLSTVKNLVEEGKNREAVEYMQSITPESDYYERNPTTAVYLGLAHIGIGELTRAKVLIGTALLHGEFNLKTVAYLVELLSTIDGATD